MAVSCAVAVLDGTAGGYSPREKDAAKDELLKLAVQLRQGWTDEHKG